MEHLDRATRVFQGVLEGYVLIKRGLRLEPRHAGLAANLYVHYFREPLDFAAHGSFTSVSTHSRELHHDGDQFLICPHRKQRHDQEEHHQQA
jgi:hypothetical protein